jgi:GT2 family glycosyltransferase
VTITVVTPWHNQHHLIPDYMAVIAAGKPDAVLVVDNGSDPRIRLNGLSDATMRVLRQDRNLGFTRACNLGLDEATTDAVLFLNSDVKLAGAATDWLQPIRGALRPGLLVGANLRTDPHGDVDGRPHAYLDGWCMAGMRADLQALGGFDETYDEPAYFSDNDLCYRARRAGMRLVEVPVPLVHLTNATSHTIHTSEYIREVTQRNRERFASLARPAV